MCTMINVQKCETKVREKCETEDQEVCENVIVKNKVCSYVYDNKDHCETHPVKMCKKVASQECISEQGCEKEQEHCETVYEKKCFKRKVKQCKDELKTVCKNVPKTSCVKEPEETCKTVQEKMCLDEMKVRMKCNDNQCMQSYQSLIILNFTESL